MPRTPIDLPADLDRLSILDESGEVDDELLPDLSDDTLREFHHAMLLSRRFDERLLQLQRQGRIGTFAPVKGQEASQIGAVAVLEESDWMVPSFRETAAAIWRGVPLSALLLYNAGYNEGAAIPDEMRDFPIAIPVASQIPHAVGLGYGAAYRGTDEVVLVFFGDGATSEGDFHEAMNFAATFEAPVVFLCQNNQWAISIPREKQTRSKTLAQKAFAYGMPGVQVDGNDVFAVREATREAVERARRGEGPTLVECVTYRLSLHTTADDPTKYRTEEEVETWEARDPLPRLQRFLIERDVLSEDDVESLEEEVREEVRGAWDEAEERMEDLGDPVDMFDHVYAEMPPYLREQRDAVRERRGGG